MVAKRIKRNIHVFASLLTIVVLSAYGYVSAQNIATEVEKRHNTEMQLSVQSLADDVTLQLTQLAYSMLFIIDQVRLHKPFDSIENRDVLAEDFVSILNTAPFFDQLRLINMDGMEVIRANYDQGSPSLASSSSLQNKKDRYYFQEAIKLTQHEIFLSRLDLNVENGRVELPMKPTLRLAMLSFDQAGKKNGMVVINALAQEMLDHFSKKKLLLPNSHIYWLNENGFWFAGAEKERLWGFMFKDKTDMTLAQHDAKAWQSISSQHHGIAHGSEGIYVFTSISPQQAIGQAKSIISIVDDSQWKIANFYSYRELERLISGELRNQFMIIGVIGFFLVSLFWVVGFYHNQRLNRLQLLQHRREVEQEQQRIRSTSSIAGGIAHEFNNILTGLSNNHYLLHSELKSPDDNKHLFASEALINRAAKLVRYLLIFSRQGFITMKQTDLSSLISNTCSDFSEKLSASIEFNVECNPDIWIEADKDKVHSIIWEMLINARNATAKEKSGIIHVRLTQEEHEFIDSSKNIRSGAFAHLTVRDSGYGIKEKDLPHIFDPFFTTMDVGKGTGLGLSMVYGAVKLHHGDITVESQDGHGAKFEIYLPLQQPRRAPE